MEKAEYKMMVKYKKGCNICHEDTDESDVPYICSRCIPKLMRVTRVLDWGMDAEDLESASNLK